MRMSEYCRNNVGMTYEPPLSLTDAIVSLVAEIGELAGRVDARGRLDRSPRLRRENRIRTIHSSLAIEANTLSLVQVSAILDGRRVLAPPRDLLEVRNAINTYEALETFDPVAIDDLLRAHRMLMGGLVDEAGRLRSTNVGVFDSDRLIHAGTPAKYVGTAMADLLEWLGTTAAHPLISSCVFHYEFEFIHPFRDGNGRMGRLWQTVVLARWNPLFAWLPVESVVKDHQEDYYAALRRSDAAGEATTFVEFMLSMLAASLRELVDVDGSDEPNPGDGDSASRILRELRADPSMSMATLATTVGVSARQVERVIARLKKEGRIRRIGARRNGHWVVEPNTPGRLGSGGQSPPRD